jgi:hypothetical protein
MLDAVNHYMRSGPEVFAILQSLLRDVLGRFVHTGLVKIMGSRGHQKLADRSHA